MDGRIQIFDGKTFDLRHAMTEHVEKGGVTGFRWFPASMSSFLCSSSLDKTCRVYNALTGQCWHTLRGHTDTVLNLDVMLVDAPDGTANQQVCVISASDDKTCKVFVKSIQQASAITAAPSATPAAMTTPADATRGAGYSQGAPAVSPV